MSDRGINLILKLVNTLLESPEVFNYVQFFEIFKGMPLFNMEMQKYYNTLELFTYGSISDYVRTPDRYLTLTPKAISKLRKLTLKSLAEDYSELYLDFLTAQLSARTKHETLDLLLETRVFGALTVSFETKHEKVKLCKRNANQLHAEQLVKVKGDKIEMIASNSMILMLPVCEHTDLLKPILITAATMGVMNLAVKVKLWKSYRKHGKTFKDIDKTEREFEESDDDVKEEYTTDEV